MEASTSLKVEVRPRISLPPDARALTIGGNLVFAIQKDGRTLTATELSTGRMLWEAVVSRVKLVEPDLHLEGDKLVVSDSQGKSIIVDSQSGKVLRDSSTPAKP